MLHSKTKYVEIDFHFIKENIHASDIVVEYVPSEAQIAYIMIKSLHTLQFQNLRVILTILDRMSDQQSLYV